LVVFKYTRSSIASFLCILLRRHIAKGRRLQGRGQKAYYWYVVVSAISSVLTFMAIAIVFREAHFPLRRLQRS
jgi:hypothetical protein